MLRLPRTALAATAAFAALTTTGAPAHAADTTAGGDARRVVTTTTTSDVNLPAVRSDAPVNDRLVDAALGGPVRLAGADRYETSVQIGRRAFTSARTVYVVGGQRTDGALAGAALTDGPVLLVPETGRVPASVLAEIRRLDPGRVVALGGTSSVSAATLSMLGQGRATERLGGDSIYDTAAAIARRAFPSGAQRVYLARVGGSADAVAGGSLTDGPVLPVPATGTAPAAVRAVISELGASRVVGLGGANAVSDATLASAAGGRATARLAGADRFGTADRIARTAFPNGAPVAYLAGATTFADVVAGGVLRDGPVLLTPPARATTATGTVAATLQALRTRNVAALGGATALPDTAIAAVVAKVPGATTGSLPGYTTPGTGTSGDSGVSGYSSSVTDAALTCAQAIATFHPVPRDSRYTIECTDDLGTASTLGLTETWVSRSTGELLQGRVMIRSTLTGNEVKAVIAHELSHAWSYSELSSATRQKFATYLGQSSFGSGDYNSMPAEVWARTQATCVGYPDGFARKQLTCNELRRFGWHT